MFKMLRVFVKTGFALRTARKRAEKLALLPMQEFLSEWYSCVSTDPNGRPVLRPAATTDAIAQAERRLGVALPDEIREFYCHADGIDWSSVDYRKDLFPVGMLRRATGFQTRLSDLLREYWERYGREEGEPEGVRIFAPGILNLIADNEEQTIPFKDIDDMVVLDNPEGGITGVLVCQPHPSIAVGSVLEIESGSATLYSGIKAWLAQDASNMAMIQVGS